MSNSITDIKKLLINKQREHSKKRAEFNELRKSLEEVEKRKKNTEANYNKKFKEAKDKAFKDYQKRETQEQFDKIELTNNKIETLKEIHEETLNNLNNELENNELHLDMEDEIKKEMDSIENNMVRLFGNEFKTRIFRYLNTKSIEIKENDIQSFIEYFNNLNEKLQKNNRFRKTLNLDKLRDFSKNFHNTKFLSSNTNVVILIIIISVLSLMFAYYTIPFYIIFLVYLSVSNLICSYNAYTALIAYKTLQDNIQKIEEDLEKQKIEDINNKIKNENDNYNSQLESLKSKLDKYENDYQNKLLEVSENFNFDSTTIKMEHESAIQILDNEIDSIKSKLESYKNLMLSLDNDVKELSNDLTLEMSKIPDQFLNYKKTGDSFEFDNKFLFDIENNEIEMFEHPENSCIILYDSLDDVYNFIKLISVQLRVRMNPFAFNIIVHDYNFAGAELQSLVVPEQEQLFNIITDKNVGNENWKSLAEDIIKKTQRIRSTAKNIKDYNKIMLENKSLTESYLFIFSIDTDVSMVNNQGFIKTMLVGPLIGIFNHLFIQISNFVSYGKQSDKFLESKSNVYIIKDGKLEEKSIDYIRDKLLKLNCK